MAPPKSQGNAAQQARLATVNDQQGVADWELEGTELHIWTDDQDQAYIHPDGTITWVSGGAAS